MNFVSRLSPTLLARATHRGAGISKTPHLWNF
jgi:hypothetical protein